MKTFGKIATKLVIGLLTFITLSSLKCNNYSDKIYTDYNPVFMKRAELENSIVLSSPREIGIPAKIYTKDKYLFISEAGTGVHIIDNSNPKTPIKLGFIKVLGCFDMAIKGNILYVDNATDLVSIELSNLSKINVSSRIVNAFPEPTPPDNLKVRPEHLASNRPSDLVLIKWNKIN
jgi:hypothetical protein